MGEITGYGVTLKPLAESHLEMLRNWRNSDEVRMHMDFTGYISAEQQLTWFRSLANETSHYFIITVDEKGIGLIHLNKFNQQEKSADVGLFIADEKFIGTGIALSASLLILEFAFVNLNLRKLTAKVKKNNIPAIQYNRFLGFDFYGAINENFDLYQLQKSNFMARYESLKKLA